MWGGGDAQPCKLLRSQETISGIPPPVFSILLLHTASPTGLELAILSRLVGQQASRIYLYLWPTPLPHAGTESLFVWCWAYTQVFCWKEAPHPQSPLQPKIYWKLVVTKLRDTGPWLVWVYTQQFFGAAIWRLARQATMWPRRRSVCPHEHLAYVTSEGNILKDRRDGNNRVTTVGPMSLV